MEIRRILKTTGKIVLSGGLAFLILTCFCFFYFNTPARCPEPSGATDYRWEENKFYSRWTEGFSWGSTNNEGYTDPVMRSAGDQIDVLLMGSSHLEGFQVLPEERIASRLRTMMPGKGIYSIGLSGHDFLSCCSNLDAALDEYGPTETVVIETGSVLFTDTQLSRAADGSLKKESAFSGGLIGILQRNPFLRLLYSQIQACGMNGAGRPFFPDFGTGGSSQEVNLPDPELLDAVLKKISLAAQEHHVRLIVVYHPAITLSEDGSAQRKDNPQAVLQFGQVCGQEGILFCDVGEKFIEEYEKNRVLPYGFFNTSVGNGHLNRYGHEMVAEELCRFLGEVSK